ncbi:MAG: HEAT repeat domain-containing protein [Planctomycetota bacterium]
MSAPKQPQGAEEADLLSNHSEEHFDDELGSSELSDPGDARSSRDEPLIQIEEPPADQAPRRGLLFLQMIVFPLLIVGVCVSIVLLIGYLVNESRDPSELLNEIRSGWGKKRMQAAYEFQMRLRENEELRKDEALAGEVIALLGQQRIWEEEDVRRFLVLSLQNFDTPQTLPALIRAAGHEDGDTVLYALFGMLNGTATPEWQSEARAALPMLEEHLQSNDAGIRLSAAKVVGKIGDPEGAEMLRPLLEDPDTFVQINATFALAALGQGDWVCDRLLAIVRPGWESSIEWAAQKTADERLSPVQIAIASLKQLDCPGWREAVKTLAEETDNVRLKTFAREALPPE